ncbi:MAG: hypothetical protein M3S32_02600 [Acidobacteriota bacterium]|nr:hypothetical protein [Acidobacteriota bacterium]
MPTTTATAALRFASFAAGALGALPLVATARTFAETLYGIPNLPGAERLMSDVKQATYLEAATLLAVVPAAALLFGRTVPAALERRGVTFERSHLPSVGFATSLLFWRSGLSPGAAVCLGLIFSAVIFAGPVVRGSRTSLAAGLLALFLGGVAVYYRPANRLDLFEDGQILFGASALSSGARPYLDVYPIHGWGADGGWMALFSGGRISLENFRILRAVATALALVSLGAAAWLFFADGAWALAGLVASLCFCPFLSERHMPTLLALGLLISAARSTVIRPWLWAGVFSALTFFSTLDFGVIFLIGGAAAPIALKVLAGDAWKKTAARIIVFGFGVLLASAPFLALLARRGALEEFFRVSCLEIPSSITPTWGVPAVSLTNLFRESSLAETLRHPGSAETRALLTLLLVLASSAFVLLLRSRERAVEPADRGATVCLLLAVLGLRGVLGRADSGHRMMYGVLAGLPAAWLFYRVSRLRAPRIRLAAAVLTAGGLCLLLRPDRVVTWQLQSLANSSALRHSEERAAAVVPGHEPSSRLPREQVGDLEALRTVLDGGIPPDQTFFDFGNEPGLYFLLQRRPPTRYSSVPCYETEEKQLEVIQALERERPPIAIVASGTNDVFDGVSNRDRAPLVARYLDEHYQTIGRVGSRTLAVRSAPGGRTRASPTDTASR